MKLEFRCDKNVIVAPEDVRKNRTVTCEPNTIKLSKKDFVK